MSNTSGPSVPEISGRLALRLLPSKVTVTLRFVPVSAVLLILLVPWLVRRPSRDAVMVQRNIYRRVPTFDNAAPANAAGLRNDAPGCNI